MKLAIIDDNTQEAKLLEELILSCLAELAIHDAVIIRYADSDTFLSNWKTEKYDLILLDIFIDKRTGIDLAKQIRRTDSDVSLVFCSSSNEFASESYEVNASYYLTKPLNKEKIRTMLSRLQLADPEYLQTLVLPDGAEILPRQIIYTEYFNHVVTIYFRQDYTHMIRISQTDLELLFGQYSFFYSPIRGILINMHEAELHKNDLFLMSNGKQIPIARRKKKEAEETYMSFRFQQLIKELKD